MTDRDNIELPPLPSMLDISGINAYAEKYARAAVLADRERRAEQATPAKPKVHRAVVELSREGFAWTDAPPDAEWIVATVTLCWTDDGRAWIESERNRGLAKELRRLYSAGASIHCVTAADALDGGVR